MLATQEPLGHESSQPAPVLQQAGPPWQAARVEGGTDGGDGGGCGDGGGGGAAGGGGNAHRGPQSVQSVPSEQWLYSDPGPPSWQ